MGKFDLRSLSEEQLEELVLSWGFPKFRGKQIFQWIYKNVRSFRDMSNVPKTLLLRLEEEYEIGSLTMAAHRKSKVDSTEKFLFNLNGGASIESVLMRYKYGNTVCISSQAGCAMGCKFCASGLFGLDRGLTSGEMISQVLDVEYYSGHKINHIVIMGTGEPFDNYNSVASFLRLTNHPSAMNLSSRNITVSTCGIVPAMERFAKEFPQVNLAISLHAPTDEKRNKIMPINRKYSLEDVIAAAGKYVKSTGRRITFEYALIKGFNDSLEDMKCLTDLLRGLNCHVNLIPLNEVKEVGMEMTDRNRSEEMKSYLEKRKIPVTIRRQLGSDIDGACGQLRLKKI